MDHLNNDCLITIFKHLDLASRLQASKTCKLWRELLLDQVLFMDDISEIDVVENEPRSADRPFKTEALEAVFSNIDQCNDLILRGFTGSILSDTAIKEHLFRFSNIRLFWNEGFGGEYATECLTVLQQSPLITNVSIDAKISDQSPLDLSGYNHLKYLEIDFTCQLPIFQLELPTFQSEIRLPPSLIGFTSNQRGPTLNTADRFLDAIQSCPLLEDLKIGGWYLNENEFVRLLNLIQHCFPNLRRVHFSNIAFSLKKLEMDDVPVDGLPLEWICFEKCSSQWLEAAEILINASSVKTMVISSNSNELREIYGLASLIKAKNATLEITINEGSGGHDSPSIEFIDVLTKLELKLAYYSDLLKSFFTENRISSRFQPSEIILFDKLTEIRLDNFAKLENTNLAMIAQWCLNLEKLAFRNALLHTQNMVTDRAIQPFYQFWVDRKSRQLSIDFANGWFQEAGDQENGVLKDGKRWVKFWNEGNKEGRCVRKGTRILIWDEDGKKMVIRDYDKDVRKKLKISLEEGGCHVKVM